MESNESIDFTDISKQAITYNYDFDKFESRHFDHKKRTPLVGVRFLCPRVGISNRAGLGKAVGKAAEDRQWRGVFAGWTQSGGFDKM